MTPASFGQGRQKADPARHDPVRTTYAGHASQMIAYRMTGLRLRVTDLVGRHGRNGRRERTTRPRPR